ncbi:MAG: 50S ribosomal protein L31 [Malacoplasma sp.]|nr:50S ribosomal protein L31 [Malacoplasma sp.]
MKKTGHMEMHDVAFNCAACNSSFKIKSTLKSKEMSIDVCSSCHPFYIGASIGQQAKGRAEKFNKKINVSQEKTKTTKTNDKKDNKKVIHSLNSL